MAQPTNGSKKPPTSPPSNPTPPPVHRDDRLERMRVSPEFWDGIFESIPPWTNEIAALALLVFGVVSLMSLLDVSSSATLARAWAGALTALFGYGAVLVCIGIFALGVMILLPRLGVNFQFGTPRILALEVAFLAALGLLHLAAGDPEFRAVARAGQGGGLIGGALTAFFVGIFGSTTALIIFTVVLVATMAVALGFRRIQFTGFLARASKFLGGLAQRADLAYRYAQNERRIRAVVGAGRSPVSALMRIRPHPNHIRPSLREAQLPPLGLEEPKIIQLTEAEQALFARQERGQDLSGIGMLLKEKHPDGSMLVRRPDGRVRRYFSVDAIREQKKVNKRDGVLPALSLLQDADLTLPDQDEINKNVVLIENTLLEFDIEVEIVNVRVGPTVTQYAVKPYIESKDEANAASIQRTRLSRIAALANDLSLTLAAKRLRLETPVPGQSYLGIEVPNRHPSMVSLRSVYESKGYSEMLAKRKTPLLIPVGRDVTGLPVGIDLAGCPHLLVAGTTGSGKSVFMAATVTALLMDNPPDTLKLVLLDPKMVELSRFNNIPHLIGPVETDVDRIIEALKWCVREMERRYKLLEEAGTRNIEAYNTKLGARRKKDHLPYVAICIDEVGDLMMTKPEETERAITRLAQMARAVGMHMIIATQRPSVDVITGLIKANFPSRIAFAVASGVDSRVILDTIGAETLLGKGDMLYLSADSVSGPRRIQGCFVGDDEVRDVVRHWKTWKFEQQEDGKLPREFTAPWERSLTYREFLTQTDALLEQAISIVVEEQEASASFLQRKLDLGYPRAARIMDLLEQLGIIGDTINGGRSRKVLIERGKDPLKDLIDQRMNKTN